ncbi:hypothetical protein BO99DRAFT_343781, partial [Aspergillus violaceofuscus CBS 115571]
VYINNIVVYSNIFNEHLQYLSTIFTYFKKLNLKLKLKKVYIEFLFIILLG